MTAVVDLVLCAFVASLALGGGHVPRPLAIAFLCVGTALGLLSAARRAVPVAILPLCLAAAGAHAMAMAPPPSGLSWLLEPAGAIALSTVAIAVLSVRYNRSSQTLGEIGLAAGAALLLLSFVPAMLQPLGVTSQPVGGWRVLVAAAVGLLQGLALFSALSAAPRRRRLIASIGLIAVAVVSLASPSAQPPLRAPQRAPYPAG